MQKKFLLLIPFLFSANFAYASTTGSVGGASVSKDKTQIEARFGYSEAEESSSQDERFRSRFQVDHGFTDYYAARLVIQQDRRKGDNLEHDSITFDNRFQFLDAEKSGFDLGIRAGYQHKDGDKKPSAVTFGVFERIPVGAYEIRLNQLFDHDVGEDADDGISAEARFQVTRKLENGHRLGVEGFHDFGNLRELSGYSDQSHQIGPVAKGALPFENMKYEVGYRAGISDAAPDHNFKLFISRSF